MFESAPPWPRPPRPLIDPPETREQVAARRAASAGARMASCAERPPHGDLSFRSPHERLERWFLYSWPLSLGFDPLAPPLQILAQASPTARHPEVLEVDDGFVREVDALALLKPHRTYTCSRMPRPWYFIRGVPELFERLARLPYLLTGRCALAAHSRGLSFEHIDVLTSRPHALLEAAASRPLARDERDALDASVSHSLEGHSPGPVAMLGDPTQGASARVFVSPAPDFDVLHARRLELHSSSPPAIHLLGLSDVLVACQQATMGLAPIDAHVALETHTLLARWPEGHLAHENSAPSPGPRM